LHKWLQQTIKSYLPSLAQHVRWNNEALIRAVGGEWESVVRGNYLVNIANTHLERGVGEM